VVRGKLERVAVAARNEDGAAALFFLRGSGRAIAALCQNRTFRLYPKEGTIAWQSIQMGSTVQLQSI
jgi:hypothetical protein